MRQTLLNATERARQALSSPIKRGFATRAQVPKALGKSSSSNSLAISVVDESSNAAWLQTRFITSQIGVQSTFSLLPALERVYEKTGKPISLVSTGATHQHLSGKKETRLVGMHASQYFLQVFDGTKKQDIFSFMKEHFGKEFLTSMPAAFEAAKVATHYNASIGFGSQAQNLNEYKVELEIREDMNAVLQHANRAIQEKRTNKGTTYLDLCHGAGKIFAPKHQLEVCTDLLQCGTTWLNTDPIVNSFMHPTQGLITFDVTAFFDHTGAILMRQEYYAIDQMNPNLLLPFTSSSNTLTTRIQSEVEKSTTKGKDAVSIPAKSTADTKNTTNQSSSSTQL